MQKKSKRNPVLQSILTVGLLVVVGLSMGLGVRSALAWVNPNPAFSPPNGNVGGPITTGSGQIKEGYFVTNQYLTTPRLSVNGIIYGQLAAGRGDVLYVGNDSKLVDIDTANTMGIYGRQNPAVGAIKLGSGGPTISGASGNTTLSGAITVNGSATITGLATIGGTATVNGGVNNNNKRLLNVATPVAGTDGVNKDYVDAQIGGTVRGGWYGACSEFMGANCSAAWPAKCDVFSSCECELGFRRIIIFFEDLATNDKKSFVCVKE